MNHKTLHLHALPIIVLALGLLIVSVIVSSEFLVRATDSGRSISNILNIRLFTLKSSGNGFYELSRYHNQSTQASVSNLLVKQDNYSFSGLGDVGKTAQFDIVMNSQPN